MATPPLEHLRRAVAASSGRRALLRALGAAALTASGLALSGATAARRRNVRNEHNVRGAKAIMCVGGVTTRVAKKRRKAYLKQGATRGACPATPVCVPACPANACGVADGCGGACGCPTGTVCNAGLCSPCTVTCTGAPINCGSTLGTAMYGGGTILVCPGLYVGTFLLQAPSMTLIGSGNGADPATSTIISQRDNIAPIFTVSGLGRQITIANVRITGGNNPYSAGVMEIQNSATTTVAFIDSVITHNTGTSGISLFEGSLSLSGCEVTNNIATSSGGGIRSGGALTVNDTLFSGNQTNIHGGGIYVFDGTTTLAADVRIIGNTATGVNSGGGVRSDGGTFNRNGATISGNTPDQCVGTGC